MTDNIIKYPDQLATLNERERRIKADGIRMARDYLWKKQSILYSGLTTLAIKVEKGEA